MNGIRATSHPTTHPQEYNPHHGLHPETGRPPLDPETERAVRAFLERVSAVFDVTGAILYGSRARGQHRPDSDADVAVLLGGEHQRFLTTKLAMADEAFDVLLETGINISPLPVWIDEWEHPEHHSNPALLRNLTREGIRFWPAN